MQPKTKKSDLGRLTIMDQINDNRAVPGLRMFSRPSDMKTGHMVRGMAV